MSHVKAYCLDLLTSMMVVVAVVVAVMMTLSLPPQVILQSRLLPCPVCISYIV